MKTLWVVLDEAKHCISAASMAKNAHAIEVILHFLPCSVHLYHLRLFTVDIQITEKGTKYVTEMFVVSLLSQLFGILPVSSSSPHFTALSLKLAGSHRQFCFSSGQNVFHVDTTLLEST